MAQKKESKKNVKVRDLAPKKDAKGGGKKYNLAGGTSLDRGSSLQGASLNKGASLDRSQGAN